ncbi:MAG: serine hydrolase domain-containing protein, partial [Gemmatimonadales bacterium]
GRDWEETTRETFEQRTLDSPLGFPPGADYRYSNAGYALLGAIVERVSGIGFHEFLEREVFQRAGLARTGFIGRSPDSAATALAGSGSTEGQSPASWSHAWNHRGSGGLLATVGDFFRWRRALLAGRVISPEAVAAMHRVQAGRYGYGVQVDEDSLGVRYEHVGLWYSFSSRFIERPSDSILVIVVSNARHGSGAVAAAPIADHLFAEASGHPGPLPPALAEDSSPPPADLAGEYRTSTGGLIRVRVAPPGLAIDGEGQEIYDALFSEGPVDSALRDLLQTRAAAILLGVRDGSFDTLDLAAPRERAERYRRLLPPIWAERQDSLGPLERVEPVGVVRRGDVYQTRAQLRYARGEEGVALTWSADGRLLGLANGNPELDSEQTTFRRTRDGGYASWYPETRRAVSIRIEGDALEVRSGDGSVLRATRDRATSP